MEKKNLINYSNFEFNLLKRKRQTTSPLQQILIRRKKFNFDNKHNTLFEAKHLKILVSRKHHFLNF